MGMKKLGAVLLTTVALMSSSSAVSAQTVETYGDFTLMFQRSAGQFKSSAGVTNPGQWAWEPKSSTESHIRWSNKEEWDPKAKTDSRERFHREGKYVTLDGWGRPAGDVDYKQVVTSQAIYRDNCSVREGLPAGRQAYALWEIPSSDYCMNAYGYIQQYINGVPKAKINFHHWQRWSVKDNCYNPFVGNKRCIVQHERWWDDNQHPYQLVLDRKVSIGKGRGMAFNIHQTHPSDWKAYQSAKWTY